jgi:F1F0 ATPase subunit 2
MSEPPVALLAAWAAGVLLGAMFFGGLWWTIRKGVSSQRPALWFLGSLMLRMSIAVTGFCVASGGHGGRLLLCLLGFVMASFCVTRLTRPSGDHHVRARQEAGHAPYSG